MTFLCKKCQFIHFSAHLFHCLTEKFASNLNVEQKYFFANVFTFHYCRFKAGEPVAQQAMFLSGVLSALKQRHLCHMHRHWVALVTSALPFMGRALTRVVLCVVAQLCRNLESLAAESAYTIQRYYTV